MDIVSGLCVSCLRKEECLVVTEKDLEGQVGPGSLRGEDAETTPLQVIADVENWHGWGRQGCAPSWEPCVALSSSPAGRGRFEGLPIRAGLTSTDRKPCGCRLRTAWSRHTGDPEVVGGSLCRRHGGDRQEAAGGGYVRHLEVRLCPVWKHQDRWGVAGGLEPSPTALWGPQCVWRGRRLR